MNTMITAHSGAQGTPANSPEYLRLALGMDCEALEIDIRPVDGVLRLTHDMPKGCEAPPLELCLDMLARDGRRLLNCDMKTVGSVEDVLAMAGARGLCHRLIFTGDDITAREQRAISDAGAQWWMNVQPDMLTQPGKAVSLLRERGAEWINFNYRYASPELMAELRAAGIRISVWTVDDEEAQRRLLELGVDNMTTRHVARALELRAQMRR